METSTLMSHESTPSPGKIFPWLALFVVLGMPLVAYLWETLHQLLAWHFEPTRLLLSIPIMGLFLGLLFALSRKLAR